MVKYRYVHELIVYYFDKIKNLFIYSFQIREKERFKQNPFNYAMKKTELMKERESAMGRGDEEVARELSQKIAELEERASHLDKRRTSTISSISYINDRNRKRNIEQAEKAIMEELRANKGKKVSSHFYMKFDLTTLLVQGEAFSMGLNWNYILELSWRNS